MRLNSPGESRWYLAAAALLASLPASAQSEWNLRFEPYVWGTSINGDLAIGSEIHEADVSFSDILDVLSGAALLHFEAVRDDGTGYFADLVWLGVERDTEVEGSGQASSAEFDTLILEGGFQRGFAGSEFALEFGLRYWDFDLSLNSPPTFTAQSDWVDGFVGGRRTAAVGQKWTSTVRFNIGGGGADFTYGLDLSYALALEHDNALLVGYKLLAFDRDDASTPSGLPLAADNVIHGLTIGFRFD